MDYQQKSTQKARAQGPARQVKPTNASSTPVLDNGLLQRLATKPQSLLSQDLMLLQRTIGNGAVNSMLSQRSHLQVGPANDQQERQADQIARQVSQQVSGNSAHASASHNRVQRAVLPQIGPEGGSLDKGMASQIERGKQGGQPVSETIRRSVEGQTAADLSEVRVHTDRNAKQTSRALGAKAFTQGKHIFLGERQSPHDVQLMAHELTHTIQQGAAPALKGAGNQAPDKTTGDAAVQRSGDGGMIQRKTDPDTIIANLEPSLAPNFAPDHSAPEAYSVTVAVAPGMDDFALFAKKRMKSKIRNTMRSMVRGNAVADAVVRAPKTSDQIKEKAAKRVVQAQNTRAAAAGAQVDNNMTAAANQAKMQGVMAESDRTGHSWIKFNLLDDDGGILRTYSFGFVAQQMPDNPTVQTPGEVLNPDMMFEDDDDVRYQTTRVKAKSFAKALERAAQIKAAPPQYSTMGYNCTKFVREVAKKAGANYPAGSGMVIPVHNIGGGLTFRDKSYMPGRLHEKMGTGANIETTSMEHDMINSGKYTPNDAGTLYSNQEVAAQKAQAQRSRLANADAEAIANFLLKNANLEPNNRAAWEAIGLTDEILERLRDDNEELWRAYNNEDGYKYFQVGYLFQTFGLSIKGLPGTVTQRRPQGFVPAHGNAW